MSTLQGYAVMAQIIMTLGTWAGTELGGFSQLQSADECMAQLQDDFMLDDAELQTAQPNCISEASGAETADIVVSDRAAGLAINQEPAVNVAMSDDKLDQLYQKAKASSAAQPELRHQLVSHIHTAQGVMERLTATSACGLAHPAVALTQRQDGLNNSLVRLVSFVENPLAKRAKPAQTAASASDAVDQPTPFAKPKPRSRKRTLTEELAGRVGNKENASAASNSQPVQVAAQAAAKAPSAKRKPRLQRCMECKACLNRAVGKQGCERNKAVRLAEQSSSVPA